RLYSNRQIFSARRSKNNRFGNIVFFSGTHEKDIVRFLNTHILSPSFFRSIFTPRIFYSYRLNKRYIIDQRQFYRNIREQSPHIIFHRRALKDYKGRNTIYDLTNQYIINENEIKFRGKKRVLYYIDFLIKKIKEGPEYKNRIIVIPVPDDPPNGSINLTNANNPLSYVYLALR